jgi:omega-6 fatty acid desaturase (delta-12 desaturase)
MAETTTSFAPVRRGKELIDATRPFGVDSSRRSWAHLATAVVLMVLFELAAGAAWWPLRLLGSVGAGLLVVRMFVIYHDFMHGAVLRGSAPARAILYAFGLLVLVPPRIWRDSHNYHHAHTAKIVGSGIGSFPMVTTDMWRRMPRRARLHYMAARHPLTILFGYVPVFMFGMCLSSLLRAPRKYWDSAVALALNWVLTMAIGEIWGASALVHAFLLPLAIACAVGGYLFYAQHNFPGIHVQPRQSWSYVDAALESSSYMPMGPLMAWVTGNIGFHHVHHLNPSIPFYRLPEAMRAVPELQHPGTTRLSPKAILACLSLKLWDANRGKMVGFPKTG